jgi:peptidoglycan/LPS O-acetylase OafA/YrhL
VAAATSVLILALMTLPKLLDSSPTYDILYSVPGALLILGLALCPDKGIARLLGSMTLVAMGELSYAFYLIHVPVGFLVIKDVLSNGFTAASITMFILGLLFLIALSWGLHVSFERPARVFLRKRLAYGERSRMRPTDVKFGDGGLPLLDPNDQVETKSE